MSDGGDEHPFHKAVRKMMATFEPLFAPTLVKQGVEITPEQELETEVVPVPRRINGVAGEYRAETAKNAPLYSWVFRSATVITDDGKPLQYVVQLNGNDEKLSCNCQGWIFCKKSPDDTSILRLGKRCKHTDQILEDAPTILRRIRNGEALGKVDLSAPSATKGAQTKTDSNIQYGRVLDL